ASGSTNEIPWPFTTRAGGWDKAGSVNISGSWLVATICEHYADNPTGYAWDMRGPFPTDKSVYIGSPDDTETLNSEWAFNGDYAVSTASSGLVVWRMSDKQQRPIPIPLPTQWVVYP